MFVPTPTTMAPPTRIDRTTSQPSTTIRRQRTPTFRARTAAPTCTLLGPHPDTTEVHTHPRSERSPRGPRGRLHRCGASGRRRTPESAATKPKHAQAILDGTTTAPASPVPEATSSADSCAGRRGVGRPRTSDVVLADYGCAQGRVSNALVGIAVRRIRQHEPDVPIHVVHDDVLANDWAGLFDTLRSDDGYLATAGGPITRRACARRLASVPRLRADELAPGGRLVGADDWSRRRWPTRSTRHSRSSARKGTPKPSPGTSWASSAPSASRAFVPTGLGLDDAASAQVHERLQRRLVDAAAGFSFSVHALTIGITAGDRAPGPREGQPGGTRSGLSISRRPARRAAAPAREPAVEPRLPGTGSCCGQTALVGAGATRDGTPSRFNPDGWSRRAHDAHGGADGQVGQSRPNPVIRVQSDAAVGPDPLGGLAECRLWIATTAGPSPKASSVGECAPSAATAGVEDSSVQRDARYVRPGGVGDSGLRAGSAPSPCRPARSP